MHVLATALFDRPAFLNCICHGNLMAEDGRKLSKRLRNYPDPEEVFESIGADALRWYLVASPVLRGLDFRIDRDGSGINEVVRLVLNPIWNAVHFFTLYANADGYRARFRTDSPELLDRYVLAKCGELVDAVTDRLDEYDVTGACAAVLQFLDALNNWYIRRSRDRFWAPADDVDPGRLRSKRDAYDSLYTVVHVLSRVLAPLLPYLTEEIYTSLTDEPSVHLTDWPDRSLLPSDPELVAAMDRAREICSAALMLREENGLRTRLPLAELTIAGSERALEGVQPLAGLIAEEVNVRRVTFTDDLAAYGRFMLKPNGRVLGPRLGGEMQAVLAAARAGDWSQRPDGGVDVAGQALTGEDFDLALEPTTTEGATAALRANDVIVHLDTAVTDELRAEGWARDLVRLVQQARRDAGLVVTDRIALRLGVGPDVRASVEPHAPWIGEQVLATSLRFVGVDDPLDGAAHVATGEIAGDVATIALARA
jgi:isoleucyl-tRNA synthetase